MKSQHLFACSLVAKFGDKTHSMSDYVLADNYYEALGKALEKCRNSYSRDGYYSHGVHVTPIPESHYKNIV